MVATAALAGVGWVASPIVTKLLNEGFSYLDDKGCSCLKAGVKDRLENLETTILPQFQLVIEAAEQSVHRSKVEQWLTKLKNALYETEDVLDLFKYHLLEEEVSDLNTHPALKPLKNVARKVNTKLSILSSKKAQLRRSLNKLEMIAAEAKTFRELLGMPIGDGTVGHDLGNGGNPSVTTYQLKDEVFGRYEEREEILKHLLDPSEASESRKRYSVVAIVGIGGAGKTTLAQFVYNDQRVIDHFEIKMWICVSRRLDVFRHTREMIELVTKKECSRFENLGALQTMLTNEIKSKKVLLVLDDVWCNKKPNEVEWENLLAPLSNVMSGSKILLTTRTSNLSVALHPQYSMSLRALEEDVIVSLFMYHAFGGNKVSDLHLKMELENIGEQIARKLHKSPLAAKTVGGQLSTELKPEVWKDVLKRDNLGDSQQALLWSYQRLDTPLQRCFSYLSLFPKGTSYQVKEMIHLWIAEGFINSSNDGRSMEDIGKDYFNELVRGSFLQLVKDGYSTNYYNMHDLFHDLAEKFSKEDCLRIEDEHAGEIPLTIRHLYVSYESLTENSTSLKKLKKLRTLIIYASHESSAIDHIIAAVIKKCKKLRVLRINGVACIETLPESIGDLKHLRYLNLYENDKLVELPASLGKLYHLQLLSLPSDANLPRSLKNLINLRHFGENCEALTRVPYIGRLTSLQTLEQFDVGKKKGYDIGQLKNLNEIRGELTISGLENVGGNNRAAEVSLKNKRHLDSLSLEWDNSELRRDVDLEVLEGLRAQPNLTNLTIIGYKSIGCPNWLLQEGCLKNLGTLEFHKCTWLEVLPDMKKLFPSCHKLGISNLPNLKKFSLLPESLKILEISECPSLVFVSREELEDQEGQEKIELILPSLLHELKIKSCFITDRALSQSLRSLAYLKCLEFEEINTITTLPSREVLQHLISLTELEFRGCSQLKSLGGLYVLPSLEKLSITRVPSLELEILASGEGGGRGILPPSLRSLYICECTTMKSCDIGDLPNLDTLWLRDIPSLASLSMSRLTALRMLIIIECPLLSSLPSNLPDSLEDLRLDRCSGILSLPEHLPKSLYMLQLQKCPGILSLPEHLPESLSQLWLWDCSGISSLPNLPNSLEGIYIITCPILEEKCQSPDGECWSKIAHIPNRIIFDDTDLSEDIA